MIRLIDAGTELLNNYNNMLHQSQSLLGPDSDAVDIIKSFAPSPASIEAIAEERAHFNVRKSRNDKAREFAATQRQRHRFLASQEQEPEPEEEIEIADLGKIDIDLDELQAIAFTAWRQSGLSTISARSIGEIAGELGEENITHQVHLVAELEKTRRIRPTHIGGEYTVEKPAD